MRNSGKGSNEEGSEKTKNSKGGEGTEPSLVGTVVTVGPPLAVPHQPDKQTDNKEA